MASTQNNRRVFKTKKPLSGFRSEYRAWKEWDEDDTIVCKLVGTSPNRKNKSKKDWIVKPLECYFSDKKEEKRLKNAKQITLNSAGQLDKGMEQCQEGDTVQIIYKGQVEMEGGEYAGEMAHTMEVESVYEDDGSEDADNDDNDNQDDDNQDDDDEDL